MARYFEYKDEKSNKFWEVSSSGKKMTVRYGKIGVVGQTLVKEFPNSTVASAEVDKAIAKKIKEGYKEKLSNDKTKDSPKTPSKNTTEPVQKKSIEEVLTELYDDNLHLFKKGYFQVQYKENEFSVYQADGSYEGSFLTLIHYILFHERLYGDYFSPKSVKVASRVIKNNPDLPPAFDDERDIDMFDELVYDATEFTYNYMKNHKLYCEEMNDWIENTGTDWQPLKKSK